MAVYEQIWKYTIVQRHIIIMIMKFFKTFIFVCFAIIIFYLSRKYSSFLDLHEWLKMIVFIWLFLLVNYGFLKFITYIIIYYNNLIILFDDQLVIIKSSLIKKDDIEYIDIYKIIKSDSFSRWFFSNILWYWTFVLEQQKTEVRHFNYISKPHKLLKIFEKQRETYKTKKYIKIV